MFITTLMYDIIIKNGLVIDPSQDLYEKMDIVISNSKIESIKLNIPSSNSKKILMHQI